MSNVDFSALSRFSNSNLLNDRFENENSIANLTPGSDNRIEQAGTYKGGLSVLFRSGAEKANNNAIRTELLKSLGEAFHIEGMHDRGDGKVTFNKQFMDRLGELFGADLKQEDFGMAADGSVASGRPLTQRRISAILQKAATYVDASQNFSLPAYYEKTKAFLEGFNALGDQRTEAGKTLAKSIHAAMNMLCNINMDSTIGAGKEVLLRTNPHWIANDEMPEHSKWQVVFYNESINTSERRFANTQEDFAKVLRDNVGLNIDLGLTGLEGVGTTKEALDAFNSDFQSKLQSFVKTTIDAWDKVQQGKVPVEDFISAMNCQVNDNPTLSTLLHNMKSLDPAG